MKTLLFLLEIGTEEMPDWMIRPALDQLAELFAELLKERNLGGRVRWADATPRRLALKAEDLVEKQPDSKETITGPKAPGPGYESRSDPNDAALLGFLRKHGRSAQDLFVLQTNKGYYWAFEKTVPGRRAIEVLAEVLPELVLSIRWPKTMYWRARDERFIRPIRWIVALLGDQTVPFELAGVKSDNITTGHRLLGRKSISVTTEDYVLQLKDNFVLIDSNERRERIESEITTGIRIEAFVKQGIELRVRRDPALLDTLVYLTEFPTPILGRFDEQYLTLPEEVLVTVMRHHQKYFPVEDAHGNLAPHFVAVMNTNADPEGLVRAGNERVLRARFNDARFFWEFDQRRKLADRVDDLSHVTWQAQLGSYFEKTKRVVDLVRELGGNELAQRAALLAKCDLTTEMVKEFPELQGVVGGLYARAQDEPNEVATAIYQHYWPLSAKKEDEIPETRTAQILSIADKVDTLRSLFSLGQIPRGTSDPYALRRAAQGAVRILALSDLDISISKLCGNDLRLREFFLDRIKYYFRHAYHGGERFEYDEINAVLAAGYDDVHDVLGRLKALHAIRGTADFEALATAFKRIKNILKQANYQGDRIPVETLGHDAERDLYGALIRVVDAAKTYLPKRQYLPWLQVIASTRPAVDRFFDQVLVMDPDSQVRERRLALLSQINAQFNAIADFSEIVTQ